MLELMVKVYNVNEGRNDDLFKSCEFLNNYCIFINRVRYDLGLGMSIKEAIVEAVRYCESQDVMKEYLESKEWELMDMIDFEFDINEAKEVWREEAEARGEARGKVESLRNIMQTLNLTAQQAMDALKIPPEEQEKYASMI